MAFGFGGGGTPFGQQQPQATPFGGGAQTNTPFGGAQNSSFGAPAANTFGGGGFGASNANQQRPAFGASSSPSFGSGGFVATGATQAGFGGGGFGATTTTPSAFGGSPQGGSFGGGSSFGGNAASPSPFGAPSSGFGGNQQSPGAGQQGTRSVPYQVTRETDSLGSGYGGQTGKFVTITAMSAYRQKSVEELRFEDYKQGVKGNVGSSPGGSFGGATGAFGGASSQSAFGGSSNSPFGSSGSGFGTPNAGFGGSVSPAGGSAFGGGGFGASSAPAFGASQAAPAFGAAPASAGAFGGGGAFGMQASAPAFGAASSPSFGGAFGGTQAPAAGAFGAMGSTPAFGAAASSPAFGGGFGASTGGAFGAMGSTPAFGAPTSAPAFGAAPGAFGAAPAASAPGFGLGGAASAPSFGGFGAGASAPAGTPGFGGFSSAATTLGASTGMFGAATTGASTFGASFSSQPALGAGMPAPGFGASGGMFGATPASGGMFGAASTASFGALGAAPGASAPSTGIFGNLGASKPFMSSAAFGTQPALGLSPTPAALGASTPSFSFAGAGGFGQSSASLFSSSASTLGGLTTPGLANPASPSLFGVGGATPATAGPTPNAATPYGQLPQLPAPKAALTPTATADADSSKTNVSGIASASRTAHTMLSPRLITPRSAIRMRPRRSPGAPNSQASGGLYPPQQKMLNRTESPRPSTPIEDSVIVARENPRKLFVRDPVVSPFSAKSLSMSDSMKSPLTMPSSSIAKQSKPTSQTKGGHLNGRSASPLNGSASKELNFLSPDSAYAKSPATPVMLSGVSVERRALLLPSIQSREYYSEPSIDDLARWAKSDPTYLEAVPNFLVGRKGYGELRYKDPVDLRNVVVDKVVQFGDKEIRVYMDNGIAKPPPGEGLNKPAEITLFNVHKVEKSTGEPVKDPEKVEAFKKKLQMRAQAQGAEFISYKQGVSSRNPKGGEYTFAVNHFSKYDGFVDDSDSEEEAEAGGKVVQLDERNLVQAMAIDSQLNPSEILMMQEMPVIEVEETPAKPSARIPSHSWKRSPSPLVGYQMNAVRDVGKGDMSEATTYGPSVKNMVNYCQVESFQVNQSCVSGNTNVITDAAAMLGRSFRVGWGPNGKFAHSGFWSMGAKQNKQNASSIRIERVVSEKRTTGSILSSPASKSADRAQRICTKYLEVHMQNTPEPQEGDSRNMECHFLSPVAGMPSKALQRKVLNVTDENVQSVCDLHVDAMELFEEDDDIHRIHVLGIWRLLACIFSQINSAGAGDDGDGYNIARRQKISQWLRRHSVWAVGRQLESSAISDLEKVILSLSKHDIRETTEQALALKDTRLASLISMAGCHMHMKEDISQQLEVWRSNSMDDLIAQQRMHVYELLSGKLENILHQHDLDWRRAFACIMWYEQSAVDPVENSIHSFLGFQGTGIVKQPLPMHAEFGGRQARTQRADTAFELLKFLDSKDGPDLKGFLNTSGYTTDALDYSLSWLILSILEGLGVLDFESADPEDQESMLHVYIGYILQLQFLGVGPEWILYVALHVPNSPKLPHLRETFVCEILNRTVSQWIDNQERVSFFTDKLGIPIKWISGTKALWYKYNHLHELEFEAYMEAEAHSEAFAVFSEVLGPRAFLRESNALSHALVPFSCIDLKAKVEALGEHSCDLHKGQQQELSLYQMFISIMEKGSQGQVAELSYESFFECFTKFQQTSLATSKFKAVVSKMCALYAESLRYSCYGKNDSCLETSERMKKRVKAASLPHMTPEEALAYVQDASSCLSGP
ncbi:nucleoporin [Chloropicon primus]|uniref:Nucleoporin n=1 Tax=Chloropicon primus TaxID=1764295 RepID=A0A5B8MLJ7_9CHLO|nr:nucleoporin [Chloropicon primus]|eukprot:QDZ20282.1 nucleoporin [Chloropicon primus]